MLDKCLEKNIASAYMKTSFTSKKIVTLEHDKSNQMD